MKESTLQAKIIKNLRKNGWTVNKIMLCNNPGWPDIEAFKCIEPVVSARVLFIEVKRPGGKTRALQDYVHATLKDKGFEVYTVSTWDEFLNITI
jgi:hypothetical protein